MVKKKCNKLEPFIRTSRPDQKVYYRACRLTMHWKYFADKSHFYFRITQLHSSDKNKFLNSPHWACCWLLDGPDGECGRGCFWPWYTQRPNIDIMPARKDFWDHHAKYHLLECKWQGVCVGVLMYVFVCVAWHAIKCVWLCARTCEYLCHTNTAVEHV